MRFVFLVYCVRSGSTMLARLLSDSSGSTVVMPEFKLPRILLSEGNSVVQKMSHHELVRLFQHDHQLEGLGLNSTDVEDILRKSRGKGIRAILESTASIYAQKQNYQDFQTVFIKGSFLLKYLDELEELFPDSTIISLVRDGRAVANSMMRSRSPYYGNARLAKHDILFCAKQWSKSCELILDMNNTCNLSQIHLRYEDILSDHHMILQSLCTTLALPYLPGAEDGSKFRVSKNEKTLHALVLEPPQILRTQAWRDELNVHYGRAFEAVAADDLTRNGYDLHFVQNLPYWLLKLELLAAYMLHVIFSVRRFIIKLAVRLNPDNFQATKLRIRLQIKKLRA